MWANKHSPHIILIQETQCNREKAKYINLNGYQNYHNCLSQKYLARMARERVTNPGENQSRIENEEEFTNPKKKDLTNSSVPSPTTKHGPNGEQSYWHVRNWLGQSMTPHLSMNGQKGGYAALNSSQQENQST